MVVRSPDRRPRSAPLIAPLEGVAIGGAVALCVGRLLSPEHIEDGRVICPFRLVTDLPCPACGLTRSWVYAAHGWWPEAFRANPFGPVLILLLGALALVIVLRRRRDRPPLRFDRVLRHPAAVGLLVLWGVFGAARMAVVA